MTTNWEMWEYMRAEGERLLVATKYDEIKEKLEAQAKKQGIDLRKGLSVSPEIKKIIRRDVSLREDDFGWPELSYKYAEDHYEDFKDYTKEELSWLDSWATCYLVSCNGESGPLKSPDGMIDGDYLAYAIIGGYLTGEFRTFKKKYPQAPWCEVFGKVRNLRVKEIRRYKEDTIRAYLVRHPNGDGALLGNQIPESFQEISSSVDYFELVSFWKNHRYNPKIARRIANKVLEIHKGKTGGKWPSSSEDCLPIIRGKKTWSDLEDRVLSRLDKMLREHRFREMDRQERFEVGMVGSVDHMETLDKEGEYPDGLR